MRKLLMITLLFTFGISLSASAFEDWILEFKAKATEVSTADWDSAGPGLLAETDSLWFLIKTHTQPWDDQFFASMPNPLLLHEGVYIVTVDYDATQWKPARVWLAGIGIATHENKALMINGFYDLATAQVNWVDESMDSAYFQPYLIATTISDLTEQYEIYRQEAEKVLSEADASLEAQAAISAIRNVYNRYMQTHGNLKGFTIAAAVNYAGLSENTLRTWQFSVMTQVNSNIPLTILATCVRETAPYNGRKVWYDVMEAKYHGMGIDNAVWGE